MSSIARVIVDVAVGREFDYAIPEELRSSVSVGSRVAVPFGHRHVDGYVVSLCDESSIAGLKPIRSVIGDKPFVSEKLLALARWMADYYCSSVEAAIRTVLPGAVRKKGHGFRKRLFVALAEGVPSPRPSPQPSPGGRGGSGPSPQPSPGGRGGSGPSPQPSPGGRGRGGESVVLATQGGADELRCADRPELTAKQAAVVELLEKSGGMFLHELTAGLGVTAAPVKALEKKGIVTVEEVSAMRDPMAKKNILRTQHLELMPEQAAAVEMVREGVQKEKEKSAPHVVLLHGVTGSGKTEVYLQSIDHVLGLGKGAIVLVPEISLTPQTVERFAARFGDKIAVLHSHLSEGERHDEWHRIRDGKARIVIGARSAVFAPVSDLGLIVVDEEHESSYKQEDAPRYNARDVAVMRGLMEGCVVMLGSATPALESWHNAKTGKYRLAELPRRADNRQMPTVRVVDMRLESQAVGHATALSRDLLDAIRGRLERAEQVMLFLNRRGFATSLVCRQCGYVAGCEQCSVSYTYHRNDELLRCHICGADRKVPARCPGCQDPSFKYSGIGTQRIEAVVKKCFPQANVQRMDADMTRRKDSYDRILGDFRVGKTDILIGTQMIAKGLHFPNVTLVGVVYADLSLHMPDFRAGERTFQLLAQVAGRAGRGEIPGEVIVQTYTPFHVAVQAARRVDYSGFCDQELEFRRELSYPPFARLVCITVRGASEDKVSFYAATVARQLKRKVSKKVIVSDPAPAPLARAKGLYRYQVMLRCASARAMTGPISEVLREVKFPREMNCTVDVDAMSLL